MFIFRYSRFNKNRKQMYMLKVEDLDLKSQVCTFSSFPAFNVVHLYKTIGEIFGKEKTNKMLTLWRQHI